jgi:hypothetical protein
MPYWIRRFIAIHMGMPENHKYANYFGISVIPTRRTKWKGDVRRYPEAQYLTYSKDKHVMDAIIKYQSRYGNHYPRHGDYRKRRRM